MADLLLADILATSTVTLELQPHRLNEKEFAELTDEIDSFRARILAGELLEREEIRKIIVWFRARREKNFSVAESKKAKETKPKAPAKPRKTSAKLSKEEQAKLAEALLASL